MIIGVIVQAVIPTGGGAATPSKPLSQDGAKEWVKKQLHNLAKLLANLAGKAAAALPGIIGSIVSWLFLQRVRLLIGLGTIYGLLLFFLQGCCMQQPRNTLVNLVND